jgi:hypothetical protein
MQRDAQKKPSSPPDIQTVRDDKKKAQNHSQKAASTSKVQSTAKPGVSKSQKSASPK